MAKNPDPARIAEPMWWLVEKIIATEPDDFEFSGAYTFKRGYHSSVNDNKKNWPNDYSIQLLKDLQGDFSKGRAFDISSKSAKRGDFRIMAKYGARIRAAALANDPRLDKWRETLGQFDTDAPPEAYDFQRDVERVPDDTHRWHFHQGILTLYVNDWEAYRGYYSVWIGQSLADYRAGVDTKTDEEALVYFAKDGAGNYYRCQAGTSQKIAKAAIAGAVQVAGQTGQVVSGVGPGDAREWERVTWDGGRQGVWVRAGWSAEIFGALLPEMDVSAVVNAVVGAVKALDVDLSDEDIQALSEAVSRTDAPLGPQDVPTLVSAFKQALREGTE